MVHRFVINSAILLGGVIFSGQEILKLSRISGLPEFHNEQQEMTTFLMVIEDGNFCDFIIS